MKKLQYVVTGTGRCGTVFLANLLTSVAIPCGHESIFTNWGIEEARARLEGQAPIWISAISRAACGDWLPDADIAADSSYMAAPFLDDDLLNGTRASSTPCAIRCRSLTPSSWDWGTSSSHSQPMASMTSSSITCRNCGSTGTRWSELPSTMSAGTG